MVALPRFGIAIKTKDRSPNRNFLQGTIDNLARAGVFESRRLAFIKVVDSGSSEAYIRENTRLEGFLPGTGLRAFPHTAIDSARRTLHQNAARCIEVASQGGQEWSMVLEDDLDFVNDFLDNVAAWLEHHPSDEPQMYVLGANYEQLERVMKAGGDAWAYPCGAFYGAQALVWRRPVAAQLAAWLGPNPSYNGITDHGHDLLLQRWGKENGLTHFIASAPSMVQHVGVASGIGNRFFQFQSFPGTSWRYSPPSA